MDSARESEEVTDASAYGDDIPTGPVLERDLEAELEQLVRTAEYARGDPSSKILFKEPSLRVVLMRLKEGGRIPQHGASGPVSILILNGHVTIDIEGSTKDLRQGGLLLLQPRMDHDIQALEDSGVLLTIGKTKYEVESSTQES